MAVTRGAGDIREVRGGVCIQLPTRISNARKSIAQASNELIDLESDARTMLRGARTIGAGDREQTGLGFSLLTHIADRL